MAIPFLRGLVLAFLASAVLLSACAPAPAGERARVVRVIDGDTIVVALLGQERSLRYIGMDTPERGRPYYLEATAANAELVEGREVLLVKDVSETDRYGRLLRYVYVDGAFVNAELVRRGYAQAATFPPDVQYADLFLSLQREARAAGRGLWADIPTQAPTPSQSPASVPTPNAAPVQALTPVATPTPAPRLAPALIPTSAPTLDGDVQITYIYYDGRVPNTEADEYVEIKNLGNTPKDLEGWVLKDISEGYPSFKFPRHILEPGATIRVYTNEGHPEWGGFNFRSSRAIWNNRDPDVAGLYDASGRLVSRKSY